MWKCVEAMGEKPAMAIITLGLLLNGLCYLVNCGRSRAYSMGAEPRVL